MKRRDKRDGMNERKAWKVERGAWKVAWWAWVPDEAGRRDRTGNEKGDGRKEMDRVRANGMNLKRQGQMIKDDTSYSEGETKV